VEVVRVEVKYSVPEDLAVWALQWSGVFLGRDYGLTGPQQITSLYLDTPSLTFFRWHSEGRADRFKLRIRGYGDSTRDRVWAEIKRKTGIVTHKQRAPLVTEALDSLLRGEAPSSDLEEFAKRRQAFNASPKLLVNCQRDALREKRASGEIGVTVDRGIRYQPTRRNDLVEDPHLWRALVLPSPAGPARAIVEVKYMYEAPTWMATLMRRLAPCRVGFSKYREAMRHHTERAAS
jgi:VTC domain